MIRWVSKALAWVSAASCVVAVVHVVALIVNRHDAPPSKSARWRILRGLPAVADEDNALVYVWVCWLLARTRCRPPSVEQCCVRVTIQRATVSLHWPTPRRTRIGRRLTLALPLPRDLTRTAWRDELSTVPAQPLLLLREGQQRLLLHAYSLAERGDAAEVRKLLAADIRFWRMVLESADLVLTKALGAAAVRRHFRWGDRVLRRLGPAGAEALPAEWRAPLTDARAVDDATARRRVDVCLVRRSAHARSRDAVRLLAGAARDLSVRAAVQTAGHDQQPLADHYSALSRELEVPSTEYVAALERAAGSQGRRRSTRSVSLQPIGRVSCLLASRTSRRRRLGSRISKACVAPPSRGDAAR